MNKQAGFIITVDIIGLIAIIATQFFDRAITLWIVFGVLCITFIAYHVVSIWLINRIKDEEDNNEATDKRHGYAEERTSND